MKKRKWLIAIIIIIVVLLLVPVPTFYKDGGSVEWKAALYTYYHWHILYNEDLAERQPQAEVYRSKDGQYWERNAFYFFPTNLIDHGFFDDLKPDKEASKKSLESSVAY